MSLTPDHKQPVVLTKRQAPIITTSGLQGLGGRGSVPLAVPLPFLLTGILAAALFGIMLPWVVAQALQAPGFAAVLVTVHLATLGWLTMAIMGASLQLTPVIIVAPLRMTRFIKWHYPLYTLGVLLLLSGFWFMLPWLMITGGTLVVGAVIHYIVIMSCTLAGATKRPLTVSFLSASLVYLSIVVLLGLTAALDLQFGFITTRFYTLVLVHLTVGIIGWLSCTVIGVSYTLVRLFALVHGHDERAGRIVFIGLNGSIIILVTGFVFAWSPLVLAGGILLLTTAVLFAYDYTRMLRLRRRKPLDVTQYHSSAAVVYFIVVVATWIFFTISGRWQPPVLTALGLAAFVGWTGQSIVGYLYKIVPFLIWHTRYGPEVGHKKVPLMREMVHERWAWTSWWLINGALPAMILSALCAWPVPLQIASAIMGAGLVIAAVNVLGIVRHLRQPASSA